MYVLVQVVDPEERMEGLDSESDSCVCSVGEPEIASSSMHWPYAGARLTMGVAKKVTMTRC